MSMSAHEQDVHWCLWARPCTSSGNDATTPNVSRHLETEKDRFVAASSVHLDFVAPGDFMHIDLASVESLELVRPLQPASGGTASKAQGSLYGCVL